MTMLSRKLPSLALASIAGALCLFADDNVSSTRSTSLTTQAEARIGRPLTPMSGAGVARRHTRRAVVGGAAVGAAAVGAYGYRNNNCYRNQYGALVCP